MKIVHDGSCLGLKTLIIFEKSKSAMFVKEIVFFLSVFVFFFGLRSYLRMMKEFLY